MKAHEKGILTSIGKKLAPLLSYILNRRPFVGLISKIIDYISIIQGKGSGSGWDIKGEVSVALSQIKTNDGIIFDVGANIGKWSKMMRENLGNNSKIYMFEPTKHCCNAIEKLQLKNVEIINSAVGSENGTAKIYTSSQASSISSLYKRRDSYFQKGIVGEEEITMIKIDDIIDDNNIEKVDIMKMDIEGHELEALTGARKAIENGIIKAITFEFGSSCINSRTFFHDFWDFLIPNKYVLYRICPGGILIKITEYYEDLEYFRGSSNYLAVYKGDV